MSLMFYDGFDDYGANGANIDAMLTSSGYSASGRATASNVTPNGIGMSMRQINTSGNGLFGTSIPFGGNTTKPIIGFHVRCPDVLPGRIINIGYGDMLGNITTQMMLIMNESLGLSVTNSTRTALLAASAPAIFYPDVWYYVEVMIDHSLGRVVVRLNEEVVIDEIVTLPAAGASNRMAFIAKDSLTSNDYKYFDNLYIIDGASGVAPYNDFLGETYVFTSRALVDAGVNEWTIVGSADPEHFKVIDDMIVADTDYLTTTVGGAREYFGIDNVPADTLEVYAVAIAARTSKGPGSALYRTRARIDTDELANDDRSVSSNSATRLDIMESKPGGGGWTVGAANDLEIGIEAVEPA